MTGTARFPGFDVAAQAQHWDDVTARVVLARLDTTSTLSFFTTEEGATAGALFDRLLAQTDGARIPILYMVDRRLAQGETDGWRYGDMPEDGEAWRVTLAALDDESRRRHGRPFCRLDGRQQDSLIQDVQDGDRWQGWAAARVWSLWTRYACTAFYSHPSAWDEIGFGGPAYPRGYKALGVGKRESWEVADRAPGERPAP